MIGAERTGAAMTEMTNFGPLGAMFAPDTPLDMTCLALLRPVDAVRAVAHVREVVTRHGAGLDALLSGMLAERNWRPQLVALTAMLARGSTGDPAALWSALDRGSHVIPQIAAGASRLDATFLAEARRRLTSFCGPEGRCLSPRSLTLRWLPSPVSTTHADRLACSLAALCEGEGAAEGWLPDTLAHPDMVEARLGDAHEHRYWTIAREWRDGMDGLLT